MGDWASCTRNSFSVYENVCTQSCGSPSYPCIANSLKDTICASFQICQNRNQEYENKDGERAIEQCNIMESAYKDYF